MLKTPLQVGLTGARQASSESTTLGLLARNPRPSEPVEAHHKTSSVHRASRRRWHPPAQTHFFHHYSHFAERLIARPSRQRQVSAPPSKRERHSPRGDPTRRTGAVLAKMSCRWPTHRSRLRSTAGTKKHILTMRSSSPFMRARVRILGRKAQLDDAQAGLAGLPLRSWDTRCADPSNAMPSSG